VSNPYNIIQSDDLSPVFLAHNRKKLISMFATVLIIYLIACHQWNFRTDTIIIGLLVIVGVDTGSHALIPLTFMRNCFVVHEMSVTLPNTCTASKYTFLSIIM